MDVDDVLLSREDDFIGEIAETWNQLSSLNYSRRQLQTCFDSATVPPISIHDYVSRLWKFMDCSVHCFGFSVAYIQRILDNHPDMRVSALNVHTLILSSVVVAAKFHDDSFRANSYYARVGGVSPNALFTLEAHFLRLLGWQAGVTPEEFESCCKLLFYHDRIERLRSRHQNPLRASHPARSVANEAVLTKMLTDCAEAKRAPSNMQQSEPLAWTDSSNQEVSGGPALCSGAPGGVDELQADGYTGVLDCSHLARSPSSQSTAASAVVSESGENFSKSWSDRSRSKSWSERSSCSTLSAVKTGGILDSATCTAAAVGSPKYSSVDRHHGSAVWLWARWQATALMESLDLHLFPCFQIRFSAGVSSA